MSMIPEDDKARKMLPLFKFYTGYFPKAMREMTKVSVVNNVRYNPGKDPADINWARGKSTDQLGSAFRHMVESRVDGKVFEPVPADVAKLTGIEKVYVLAEAMWRLGAELELTIEREESKPTQLQQIAQQHALQQVASQGAHALNCAPVAGCECSTCTTVRHQAATRV